MNNPRRKDVLTTGQVAKICHVAPRTVSKWFDTGKLRGYRIPGSRDRRIPIEHLLAFMRAHSIPMDELDDGQRRVLMVGANLQADVVEALGSLDRYEVRSASSGFGAGVTAQQFRPHVMVLEASTDAGAVATICRNIKSNASFSGIRIIAVSNNGLIKKSRDWYAENGFDAHIDGSYSLDDLVAAIDGAKDAVRT